MTISPKVHFTAPPPLGPPPSRIFQRRPPHRRPSSPPCIASRAELHQEGASRRLTHLPLRSTRSLAGLPLETRTTDQPPSIERISPTDIPKDLSLSPDAWCTSKALNLPEETIDRFLSSYETSHTSSLKRHGQRFSRFVSIHSQVVSGRTVTGSEIQEIIDSVFVSSRSTYQRPVSLNNW